MSTASLLPLSIPSPDSGVWYVGSFPIRGYALAIIAGILLAAWISERRWVARGGKPGEIYDLLVWGIPFGLVGGRLYHVLTDWQLYFGEDRNPVTALYIWRGGLGVWGAIALGALGVVIGARLQGVRILPMLDTIAPTVLVAQAVGRWGNWFNQELYGRPTDLPWAVEIDREHFTDAYRNSEEYAEAVRAAGTAGVETATFHPTFLYESLWNLAAFALLLWLERRFRLGHGRVAAAYVMLYTAGRAWIEHLRIDDVQLIDVLGVRFNVWMSLAMFALAAAYFWWSRRRHPGREESVRRAADAQTG